MRKRLLTVLLVAVMVLTMLPGASAEPSLFFVAMNDSVPLYFTDGSAPYYNKGKLYLPYTAFQVSPNGVGASYNGEKGTFVLFNSGELLLFDLEQETYTDNRDREYEVDLAYRGGILYVPASVASHFGLSVTLLVSRAGYSIIRFTNGEQVYDDGTFVAQAENLITHVAQQVQTQQSDQPNSGDPVTPPIIDPPVVVGPAEVYMAFAGDAVSKDTLRTLAEHQLRAAFFLTEDQILLNRSLVRAIYAAGHTIGLTIPAGETDILAALDRANDALDSVLFCRSVYAMLPAVLDTDRYHVLTEPARQPTVEAVLDDPETTHLYVIRNGALGVIESFVSAEANLPQLLETTFP